MSTDTIWLLGITKAAWLTIVLPLLAAFVLVGFGYFVLAPWLGVKVKLRERMGTGTWKFSESWASTLTASGAVLGLILAAQETLPQETKGTYVMLNLMFGAIIVGAALLYNAIRWPKKSEEKDEPNTENQGFVCLFLISSAMVLWALFGQLVTTWYLLGELSSLPIYIHRTFRVLIGLSVALTIVYGAISVPWTLSNQLERREKDWILM